MSRSIIEDTARSATTAVKTYKRSNPLLMRKKMELKDVYFRKDEPEREVMRFELAFDIEQYFIVIAGACLIVYLACRLSKMAKRHAMKKAAKAKLKAKRD